MGKNLQCNAVQRIAGHCNALQGKIKGKLLGGIHGRRAQFSKLQCNALHCSKVGLPVNVLTVEEAWPTNASLLHIFQQCCIFMTVHDLGG